MTLNKDGLKAALLPCPFCGDRAFRSVTLDNGHYVMCRSEACWAMTGYLPTEAEAIAAWNRRQSPAGVEVRAAAERLLAHWDESEGPEKRGAYEGVEYWSPSGRMVDTEFIADLRSCLSVETAQASAGVEPVADYDAGRLALKNQESDRG